MEKTINSAFKQGADGVFSENPYKENVPEFQAFQLGKEVGDSKILDNPDFKKGIQFFNVRPAEKIENSNFFLGIKYAHIEYLYAESRRG